MDALPGAIEAPGPEVAIHRLPRRILPRQGAPGDTSAVHVEDPVQYLAHVGCTMAPSGLGCREERGANLPLSVGHVAGGELVAHTPMLVGPAENFQNTLSEAIRKLFRFSCREITQHPCDNETPGDHQERGGSA